MSEPLTGEVVGSLMQDYLRLLIASDELFSDVTVMAEDDGDIEFQMDQALGIVTRKEGKAGVCVIVRQPQGGDSKPGMIWPPLDLEWDILVLEWRGMNKDTAKGGTGKRAWTLARRVHRIAKAHRAPGVVQCFTARTPTIIRSSLSRQLNGVTVPLVGYTVRLASLEADSTLYTKVSLPLLSGAPPITTGVIASGSVGTVLTVTCATSGAAIYYTTDLSNPCAQNENATLYATPLTVEAGTYMFRAFVSGSIGSDSVAVSFS